MNIMYGMAGERRLTEVELGWLPGYENSRPVRIGNAAWQQFQLDVFGEVADALHLARRHGLHPEQSAWQLQCPLIEHLESVWSKPDNGIWEFRGEPRHFTQSKVMAWVALDRVDQGSGEVRAGRARGALAAAARHDPRRGLQKGFDAEKNSFVQSYGGQDAGRQPADDSAGRLSAAERSAGRRHDRGHRAGADARRLCARYPTEQARDGLPPGEGVFLPCTFWLADCLALQGRHEEANRLFERLLSLCNDVGLISEEYDPQAGRLLGNFPQAFTHVGLINTAWNLSQPVGPAVDRQQA